MPKKKKNGTEKIHGKKVKIGKETGKRVAKRATSARLSRKARREKLLRET
jgi:hypothetical protein